MCKAAVHIRSGLALDQKLQNLLTQKSTLVDSARCMPQAVRNESKNCLALGLCVCKKHPDAGFFFVRLSMYLRHICWKKKKEKTCSPQRLVLESHSLILEIRQSRTMPKQSHAAACDGISDWDEFYQQESACEFHTTTTRLFLHIGRIDFRSWHFGALALHELEGVRPPSGVCFVQPTVDSAQHGVYSDVEAFAYLLDLARACTLKLHQISLKEDDWLQAPRGSVAIREIPDTPEFMVWQGSAPEQDRRKKTQQAKPRKRPGKPKPGNRPRKRNKRAKGPLAIGAGQVGDAALVDRDIGSDSDLDPDHNMDVDAMLDVLVSAECAEAACAFETEENEKESDGDRFDSNAPDDVLLIGAASPPVSPRESDNDDNEFEASVDADGKAIDIAEAEAVAHIADGADVVAPALPAPAGAQDEQQENADQPIERPAGVARSTLNRTVFEVRGHGELHYYHMTHQMVAFCALRNDEHSDGCRKQMTTAPKSRGSGRPIGFLVSWLMQASEHNSKQSHVHCSKPTYEQRLEARKFFETLPHHERFAAFEKAKRANEDSEPREV